MLKNVSRRRGCEHGCCLPPWCAGCASWPYDESFLYLVINSLSLLRFLKSSAPSNFVLFLVVTSLSARYSFAVVKGYLRYK